MIRLLPLALLGVLFMAGCAVTEYTPDPDPNATTRVVDALYYYPAGDQPFAVAVADLNSDGYPDVITANEEGDTVSVLLGTSSASFELQKTYATSPGPVALVVADFNGDTLPDLATANTTSNSVSILLATADGFAAPARYDLPEAAAPAHLVAADLDGNTTIDLAIANQDINTCSLFLGNGDGTFDTTPTPLDTGSGPRYVLAETLNGDTLLDLITVNRDSGDLSLFLSNALGGYDAPLSLTVGTNPRAAALADLNGDAFPDLVVSNPGSNDLSLLPGAAGGTFGAQSRVSLDGAPTRFATGDFNGDGDTDVAALLFDASAGVSLEELAVLLGDGAGGMGAPRLFGARGQTIDVVAADIRDSAALDLIIANASTDDIGVLAGRGDGTFKTDERFLVGSQPRAVVTADFNKDGDPDLAVLNQGTADLSILLGKGDTTFEPETTLAFTGTPRAMDIADFNNDANTDLVVTDLFGGEVSVYLGRGDGTFQPQRRALVEGGGSDARSVSAFDMDGDGNVDIVVGNSGRDSLSILLGDGTGDFGAAAEFDARNFPLAVKATDLNGDGDGDVVFINGQDPNDTGASQSPRVRPLLGIGEGALEASATYGPYSVEPNPVDLALRDLDGDGDLDGVTAHPDRDSVDIVAGVGGGRFLAGTVVRAGDSPNSVGLGLLDNDRFADIVATCDEGTVCVLLGRGSLLFSGFILYPAGTNSINGIIVDLDGDRHAEIVFANLDAGTISVLRGSP